MFNDAERNELLAIVQGILADNKAGRPDTRENVATQITDRVRAYLNERYDAGKTRKQPSGTVTLKDALNDEDFKA